MSDRVIHVATPEEANRLDVLAKEWEAELPAVLVQMDRAEAAAREPSLAGRLRKAILDSVLLPDRLAEDCGIDLPSLLAFQAGQADLPLAAIERLSQVVGLRLVLEKVGSN
jgi:hypothetical protein